MSKIILAPQRKSFVKSKDMYESNEKDFLYFVENEAQKTGKSKDDIIKNFKPIDMTYPRLSFDDPNVMVRYCASFLSIPKEAFNVFPIWDSIGNREDKFNKKTRLEYGFTYKIRKEHDRCFVMRKIERDVIANRNSAKNNLVPEHFFSYNSFIKYYDDEKFGNPQNYQDSSDEENEKIDYYEQYQDNLDFYNMNKYISDNDEL